MNIKRKLPLVVCGALLTTVLTATSVFASTGTVTAQTVRVRQAASTDSQILKRVYKDEKVEITGEEGDWYKVNAGGIEGYVSKAYLTVSEETEPAAEPEPVVSEEPKEPDTQSTVLGDTTTQETKAYIVPTFDGVEAFSIDTNKKVEVIATLANWSKVRLGSQEGWIPNTVLMATSTEVPAETTPAVVETPETSTEKAINQKGYISSNASANFRSEPTTNSTSLNKLPRYTEVSVISELSNGWYKVSYAGKTGYISKSLVTLGTAPEQPSSRNSDSTRSTTTSTTTTQSSSSSQVVTGVAPSSVSTGGVVATAQSLVGSRYTYGGSSPSTGFDCSGFTSYVYAQYGVKLNRTASGQLGNGVAVSKAELQPGDLVMFGSSAGSVYHVGIYVGNGQMIHAANSNRGVVYDTINSGYYYNNYYGARRVQ